MAGVICYCYTNGIVTNIKLPDNMVSPNELGRLELEHNIEKGIFISAAYGISQHNLILFMITVFLNRP